MVRPPITCWVGTEPNADGPEPLLVLDGDLRPDGARLVSGGLQQNFRKNRLLSKEWIFIQNRTWSPSSPERLLLSFSEGRSSPWKSWVSVETKFWTDPERFCFLLLSGSDILMVCRTLLTPAVPGSGPTSCFGPVSSYRLFFLQVKLIDIYSLCAERLFWCFLDLKRFQFPDEMTNVSSSSFCSDPILNS